VYDKEDYIKLPAQVKTANNVDRSLTCSAR